MDDIDDEEAWHGLDEAKVRMDIRALAQNIAAKEVDSHSRMVRQFARLNQLVREEVGRAVRSDFNRFVEYHPKETAADCRRLVESVERDLADLGLVMVSPGDTVPVRLGVSDSPPRKGQSWLQLEPIGATGARPAVRIERPFFPKFDLVPEPPRAPERRPGARGR